MTNLTPSEKQLIAASLYTCIVHQKLADSKTGSDNSEHIRKMQVAREKVMEPFVYVLTSYYLSKLDGREEFAHLAYAANGAFSSFENAVAYLEASKNSELNPGPFEWVHYDTDQEGMEIWVAEFNLFDGEIGHEIITKYPLDAPHPYLPA